jgi:hypothetical protein
MYFTTQVSIIIAADSDDNNDDDDGNDDDVFVSDAIIRPITLIT